MAVSSRRCTCPLSVSRCGAFICHLVVVALVFSARGSEPAKFSRWPRVLVILTGQPRGGPVAWMSLLHYMVEPLSADLATYFISSSPTTILQEKAKYNWVAPDVVDWAWVYDQAAESCSTLGDWRILCNVDGMHFGGVKGGKCDSHGGSGGIIFALRWLVMRKLLEQRLIQRYDYFILSRADQLHLCQHYPLSKMDQTSAWVPVGEDWGGVCDRHLVGARQVFLSMINITGELVCHPKKYEQLFRQKGVRINSELAQLVVWNAINLPVQRFQRTMLLVKTPSDPTNWVEGTPVEELRPFGLLVKYPDELTLSKKFCNISVRQGVQQVGTF